MASKAGLEPKPFFEIEETVMMKRWRLFIYIYIYILGKGGRLKVTGKFRRGTEKTRKVENVRCRWVGSREKKRV